MRYKFYLNIGGFPEFELDPEFEQLLELGSIDQVYLAEILKNLESVLAGELSSYYFGQEVYNLGCDKENCKVYDCFEDWRLEHIIPTIEIYQFLKDWKAYVDLNPR